MPSINDIYSGDLLKADDLDKEMLVTIVKAEPQVIRDQTKLVVTLDELDKKLVLNSTNAKRIAEITNKNDYTQWSGTEIKLYKIMTTYKGVEVPAIRVKSE